MTGANGVEALIDDLLRRAYGEAEARRIAGSYRLAALAVRLQRDADASAAARADDGASEGATP